MKRMIRMLLIPSLLVAVVALVVWAFLPEPVLVDLAVVESGLLRVTVDEDGKTRIRERYIVSTPLAGRLLRIELDPGDPVTGSQTLLATIQPRDPELLDPRAIAQAKARVRASAATLQRTSVAREQALLEQTDAERDLQRARKLADERSISQSRLEDARTRFDAAGESLRAARYAEDIARFELEQAEAALIRSLPASIQENGPQGGGENGEVESEPGDSTPTSAGNRSTATDLEHSGLVEGSRNFLIHSPIDGRVLRVFQESAAVVSAGTPLLELGDPRDLEIVVDVLSQDAVKIRPGNIVSLEHWGGERPLGGRVRLVEPAAFTKISTLGVEEQRVNVIIDLVDPTEQRSALGDGFRVEARVIVWEEDDILRVPTSALFRVGEDWAAFRVVEDRARQTRLQLGQQNGLEAQVLDGLKAGDRVIVHPSDAIDDGVRVAQRNE